jgi:glycosyltransferase involved in cell wall biosynthesis
VFVPDVTLVAPYPTAGQRHAGPSGVASYSANLAHALADRGAAVDVVAPVEPDAPDEPLESRDGPVRVRRPFARGPRALRDAAAAAIDARAPIVHIQHELFLYGGPTAVPALVPALGNLRRRTRPVVTLHQVVEPSDVDRSFTELHRVRVPPRVARRALQGVQRSLAALSSACVVHEEAFARTVDGAIVIPHGVEQQPKPDRTAARAALGLDDARVVVLCFGFVAPYKGLETVLEARAQIPSDDLLLVVAGGPHPRLAASGDPYAARLASRHGGPGTRFTGWVPEADVPRWFGAADAALFAYPSPFSSSGALALAFAHRTPVLLSEAMVRCTGAPSELGFGSTAAELAQRLRRLLDPRDRVDLARATACAAARREWPRVADAHLDLYDRLAP